MKQWKKVFLIPLSFLLLFSLSACKKNMPAAIVGDWLCEETPLQSDAYTGYLALDISDNGEFSLYDYSGNPGISGTLEAKENTLHLSCDPFEFDPPTTWEDMAKKQTITYEVKDEKLYLTYEGTTPSTLVFNRE